MTNNAKLKLHTLKLVEIRKGIKTGLGLQHFCREYQCDEMSLMERIGSLSFNNPRVAREILSELKKNDKKRKKKPEAAQAPKTETPVETDASTTKAEASGEEQVIGQTQCPVSKTEQIETLRETEKMLSDEVIKLETEHKTLAQEHKGCIKRLRDLRETLSGIESALRDCRKNYEYIVQKNNALVMKMNKISKERSTKVVALEGTREQIKELDKIGICVYLSGEIAPLDDQTMQLDETGSDELYSKLIENSRCQDLRVKSIKVLARALRIVANSQCKVEIAFEDPELEKAFQLFS